MFKKILIPIDVSREKNAARLCALGADYAEASSADVRLLSVMPDYGMPLVASYFPANAQKELKAEMVATLDKLAQTYFSSQSLVTTHLRQGKRAREILKEAREWQADLILVGCRRKASAGGERVMGSCSLGVAERAPCSVLVMR